LCSAPAIVAKLLDPPLERIILLEKLSVSFPISIEVEFVQDGTGGRTLTLPATVVETVSISTAANSITILTFRTNDGGTNYHAIPALRGSISLGGVSALTPWTEDIDADGFDLQDLSNIEFRDTTGAPATTVRAIYATSASMFLNVPTEDF